MGYNMVVIKDDDFVFEADKAKAIDEVLNQLRRDEYYLFHDRVYSLDSHVFEWVVCIIVLSEKEEDVEKLMQALWDCNIEKDKLIPSHIKLGVKNDRFTIELPIHRC